jgi:beta-lactam-binding protein with PASTA domain
MALLVILIFGGVLIWLKFYTNHGQEKELKDYIGIHIDEASKDAEKQSFEMIVKDSIHKVDQPGGIIIAQNPAGGSKVKENRKIYVDITKYKADEYDLSELSTMYGSEYNSKQKELAYLSINSKVRGERHDAGDPGHILEVWYNGRLIDGESGRKSNVKIERGGTLEFVISKIDGGQIEIPDLVCRQYGQLKFLLQTYRLNLGEVEISGGAITNQAKAYVIAQDPEPRTGATIGMGGQIKITIQQQQPLSCQ